MEKLYVVLKITNYGCGREPAQIRDIYHGYDEEEALKAVDDDFEEELQYVNGDTLQDGLDSYLIDNDEDKMITYQRLEIQL